MSSPPEGEIQGDHALQSRENRLDHDSDSRTRDEGEVTRIPRQTRLPSSPQKVGGGANGTPFYGHHESQQSHGVVLDGEDEEFGDFVAQELPEEVSGSPNESASIPDDTPSIQVSLGISRRP